MGKPNIFFNNSKFSRRLLLFALLFGLVGGYILLRTFASPNPNLLGDLNNDNIVNISDLSILLTNFNTTNPTADIDLNGTVNTTDLSILLSHWGQSYTPPPPSATFLYSSNSFWNTPIASNATIDPNSATMAQSLVTSANGSSGTPVAIKSYSVSAFYADSTTPRVIVTFTTNYNAGATRFLNVPMPPGALPANGTDGHMMIIDKSTNCEYDFWKAVHNADGSWSAGTANAVLTTGDGNTPKSATPSRGSSFALGGGLILPGEMNAGLINHALVFSMDPAGIRGGGPVLPSFTSDGAASGAATVPEGARVRLDPTLDINAQGWTTWQRTIAKALQTYGMYLGDRGGGLTLYALDTKSTIFPSFSYPWGDLTYAYMPASLYSHMQILTLGSQITQVNNLVQPPTVCGSTLQ